MASVGRSGAAGARNLLCCFMVLGSAVLLNSKLRSKIVAHSYQADSRYRLA
jgi:hypothetical protein